MKSWTEQRIDRRSWKRVPGNPFADYDPKDGIALWSLWEMPSSSVGKLVRRGPGRLGVSQLRCGAFGFPSRSGNAWKRRGCREN